VTREERAAREVQRAWRWGRRAGSVEDLELPDLPARFVFVCDVRRTCYETAKGPGARSDLWEHPHRAPFQAIYRAARPGERGIARPRDLAVPRGLVISLGRLVDVVGEDARGRAVRLEFSRECRLCTRAGDRRMLLLGAPLWIRLGESTCEATAEGLIL
jgi:hypothetical protein